MTRRHRQLGLGPGDALVQRRIAGHEQQVPRSLRFPDGRLPGSPSGNVRSDHLKSRSARWRTARRSSAGAHICNDARTSRTTPSRPKPSAKSENPSFGSRWAAALGSKPVHAAETDGRTGGKNRLKPRLAAPQSRRISNPTVSEVRAPRSDLPAMPSYIHRCTSPAYGDRAISGSSGPVRPSRNLAPALRLADCRWRPSSPSALRPCRWGC